MYVGVCSFILAECHRCAGQIFQHLSYKIRKENFYILSTKKKKKCRRLQIRKRVSFSLKNCNSKDTDSSKTENVLRKKESATCEGKTMSLYSETRGETLVLK